MFDGSLLLKLVCFSFFADSEDCNVQGCKWNITLRYKFSCTNYHLCELQSPTPNRVSQ